MVELNDKSLENILDLDRMNIEFNRHKNNEYEPHSTERFDSMIKQYQTELKPNVEAYRSTSPVVDNMMTDVEQHIENYIQTNKKDYETRVDSERHHQSTKGMMQSLIGLTLTGTSITDMVQNEPKYITAFFTIAGAGLIYLGGKKMYKAFKGEKDQKPLTT